MKNIIICEGKTDAILIGYFLCRVCNCQYAKSNLAVALPVKKHNEVLNWFSKAGNPEPNTAVWGVGGYDRLTLTLADVISRNKSETDPHKRFKRIVLFWDHDKRSDKDCFDVLLKWIQASQLTPIDNVALGIWFRCKTVLEKTPHEDYEMEILAMILPPTGEGELETFLIDSLIKNSDDDRIVVENARNFIDQIPDEPYLRKVRHRTKACLGAILSVCSPDWVFSDMNTRLCSVPWEKILEVAAVYDNLRLLYP
jgi:hypothetical protein